MELTGRLVKLLPIQTGTGKNGEWKKLSFVIETDGQHPKQICFDVFKDEKIEMVQNKAIGSVVTVKFDIESREYNGKYFTNVNAWSVSGSSNAVAPAPVVQEDPLASVLDGDGPGPADPPKRTQAELDAANADMPF